MGRWNTVVWDDKILITSPTERRREINNTAGITTTRALRKGGGRNPRGDELFLIYISRTGGKILWQRELDKGNQLHRKGNDSSTSPVTDGAHVWVVTGTGKVTAFDMKGNKLWGRNLQNDCGEFGLNWGYASLPLHHDGKLIIEVLHGFRTDNPS